LVEDECDDPTLLGTDEVDFASSDVSSDRIAEEKFQEYVNKDYVQSWDHTIKWWTS